MGVRMSVTVDEELIEQVKRVYRVSTKSEAIRLALEAALRRARLEEALRHAGNIELNGAQEELVKLREEA